MSEGNTAPQQEPAALGVADLQNAAQIIDAAVTRGAFKASEAAQVGAVYNKIQAFIQSVVESQQQQTEETTEAPASE
jgi:hypothetical protein